MGTWDIEDKGVKETEHTRGAKLVSGDARFANMANKTEDKTEHICGQIREDPVSPLAYPSAAAARREEFRFVAISNKYYREYCTLSSAFLFICIVIDTYLAVYLNQYFFELRKNTRNDKSHQKKHMNSFHNKVYFCSQL